jgi:1-acyl-sn-glycerol-3-phosphate acyltransferase
MASRKPSRIARGLLRMFGWTAWAEHPGVDRYVLVVAPHTSNWDFPLGMLAARTLGLDPHWMGKHTLFRGPMGGVFRRLGGIPVDRAAAGNRIEQMAQRFADSEHLVLTITPEGTRSHTDHWKTGFWHIARAAGVPIAMACLDYGRKQVVLGGSFMPSDNIHADFEKIRGFYADRIGKSPAGQGEIRPRA